MEKENTEEKVHRALRAVVRNSNAKALNYAINYAKAGLHMTGETLRIKCIYVLGNMTHWRGEEATAVRKTLKKYTKGDAK